MKREDLHIKSEMKVPSGYFEKSYKQFASEFYLRAKISEKQDFIVPEKYFIQSRDRILDATKPKESRLFVWRYAVASVAIFLVFLTIFREVQTPQEVEITRNISDMNVQNDTGSILLEDIFQTLSEQNQSTDTVFIDDEISDSEIEQYLIDYAYMNSYFY